MCACVSVCVCGSCLSLSLSLSLSLALYLPRSVSLRLPGNEFLEPHLVRVDRELLAADVDLHEQVQGGAPIVGRRVCILRMLRGERQRNEEPSERERERPGGRERVRIANRSTRERG